LGLSELSSANLVTLASYIMTHFLCDTPGKPLTEVPGVPASFNIKGEITKGADGVILGP
jgi:hypothetical protein